MSRAQKRRVIALTATLALAGLAGSGFTFLAASTAQAADSPLAFELPQSALRTSPKKVFAHYMPSMPMSFDNKDAAAPDYWTKNYMHPEGESGKHASYGGFTRDAPSPRIVRSGDWKLANMQEEVRQAVAAGIDGFTLDLLSVEPTNYNWTNSQILMQAATSVDKNFKIVLVPDMTTSVGSKTQAQLAASMAELAKSSAAYRLSDGRLVISPFKAEVHDAAWWKTFISTMKSAHGINVAFVPMFLDERPYLDSFAPISYGMSVWGNRNPKGNDYTATGSGTPLGRVKAVRDRGLIWMQPVSYQDERPRSGIFDEAENTTNLRNTWQIAMASKSEWVQLVTWNDYAEGSQLAPSVKHGWGPLDLNAYYLTQYKTGSAPAIVRDSVLLTHRTQPYAAKPSYPQTKLMSLRGGSSPARDTVEALTMLTKPATVSITVGSTTKSCSVPAGVGICTVPLEIGKVSAKVVRNGFTTATVTSPHTVTKTPYVQDLQYVSATSLREGTWKPEPTSTTTTTTSPVAPSTTTTTTAPSSTTTTTTTTKPTTTTTTTTTASPTLSAPLTVRLEPVADTYANELAASTNYGTSSSLASRGSAGYESFLRFAIPAPPAGKKLVSAVLTVHTSNLDGAGSTDEHQVRQADNNWDEKSLTWKNRPARSTKLLGTFKNAKAMNSTYSTYLVATEITKLANSQATFSVTSTGTDNLWFWSADHANAGLRPDLVLTYG